MSFKRQYKQAGFLNLFLNNALSFVFCYSGGMEIEFNVRDELSRALAQFTQLRTRDLPFVCATAINMTMKQVKADMRSEMERIFDAPTPFTLNSLQTYPFATKEELTAVLRFRDFAGKGTPAGKYLAPEIYGGARRQKSFEKALSNAGLLPAGMFAVPAKPGGPANEGAPLDQYGNIKGSYLNRMLSYLRANRDSTQNRSQTSKRRRSRAAQWFVINTEGKGLPMGIYERKAGVAHMVIKYVRAPMYPVRFKFGEVAQASAAKHFPANIDKAANIAISALNRRGAQWNANDLLSLFPLSGE